MKFTSSLQTLELPFTSTGIPIPVEIWSAFPAGKWRMQGTINGIPFNLAPRPIADGSRYLTVGNSLRKALKIQLGDPVSVEFDLVDPDMLKVPQELQTALELDADAMQFWQQYTTGLQRSLVHYIHSAKTTETRIKRALELTAHMKTGRYPLPQKRK
jgi:hypothetical protein